MFWVLFVRKYSKLTKFIQKIDPNSRMPRIFMDLADKSAFYICVISCNKMARLGKGYSTYRIIAKRINQGVIYYFRRDANHCAVPSQVTTLTLKF